MSKLINERLNSETDEIDEETEDEFEPIVDDPVEKALLIAHAADSLKAEDITVLDLRGLTIIADFFILCTGNSSIQLRAIAERIEEKMRDHGFRKLRVEGY